MTMRKYFRPAGLLIFLAIIQFGHLYGDNCFIIPLSEKVVEPVAAEQEDLYLGMPFSYWVEQAGNEDSPEEVTRIVEALTLALKSEKSEIRVMAADALGRIGPEAASAVPELIGLFEDRGWPVVTVFEVLTEIGPEVIPNLIEEIKQRDATQRSRLCSVIVLGKFGPEAKEAIPVLEQLLTDESLQTSAANALDLIRGKTELVIEETSIAIERAPIALPKIEIGELEETDWPRFHGPANDGLCRETGLLQSWPEEGLKLLWTKEDLGEGHSAVSIVDGKIFTMGQRIAIGRTEKSQYLFALDLESQKELWAVEVGPPHGDGPRCTPTVDKGLVYAIGTDGDVFCVEAESGRTLWQKSLVKDFDGEMMSVWKFSESPLIDGEKLICTPGGKDATIIALDKKTGEQIWKFSLPDIGEEGRGGAGYAWPIVAEIGGVRQYLQILGKGLVSLEAETGRLLWSYNKIANSVANIVSPVVIGDYVFTTSSYGVGSAFLKIVSNGAKFHVEEMYFLGPKEFANMHGGVVLIDGHIYGGHGQNRGEPTCVELATGKTKWKEKALGRGSAAVLYADGHLIFRYDRGLVALVEATQEAFRLKGSFTPVLGSGPAWAHPVIHDGKLYLRHGNLLACYSLKKSI